MLPYGHSPRLEPQAQACGIGTGLTPVAPVVWLRLTQFTAAPKAGQPADTVATEPLSGEARAALLAKVVAGEAAPAPASQGPVAGTKPSEPVSHDEQISAASATTARAFDAGVVRVEPQGGAQAKPEPGTAGGEGDKASPAGDAREAKPSAAPRAETTASGTTTPRSLTATA